MSLKRTVLLLGGWGREKGGCRYLRDTRSPPDKFWTIPASLSTDQLEGVAGGLDRAHPAAAQQQREAVSLWNGGGSCNPTRP